MDALEQCRQAGIECRVLTIGSVELVWLNGFPDENLLSICDRVLSPDEVVRGARYVRELDGRKFRFRRGLLRLLLAERLPVNGSRSAANEIVFAENPYGKPNVAGIEFNYSHSGQTIGFGFAGLNELGIDIEQHRELRELDAMAAMIMHPEELRCWRSLAASRRTDWFFDLWSLKEAVLKCLGCGLSLEPATFQVQTGGGREDGEEQQLTLCSPTGTDWTVTVRLMRIFERYSAAVAEGRAHQDAD